MRKRILIMVALAITLSLTLARWLPEQRVAKSEPLDSYTGFALDFLKRVGIGERNTAASPLSVYAATLMLVEGSNGSTKAELLAALRLSSVDEARQWFASALKGTLEAREPAKIVLANGVWVQNGFPVRATYLRALSTDYLAEVKHVDFASNPSGSAEAINEWVRNKTYDLIDRVLDPASIDTLTRVVLVNALYFRGNWTTPFETVTRGAFHSPDGEVEVGFLRGRVSAQLLDTDSYTAVALGYNGTRIKFVAIMPKGDVADYVKTLSEGELLGILSQLLSSEPASIELLLPVFDVDSGVVSVKEALEGMGVKEAFDPYKADLSPMVESGERILYVKDVYHRARVRVGLAGTEAAAATAVVIAVTSVRPSTNMVKIDRPFLFFLVDPESRAIVFAGSVLKP